MMRSRIRGDDDFAQAASAAVTRNTDDLTAVVKAMFGEQAATAFHGHVDRPHHGVLQLRPQPRHQRHRGPATTPARSWSSSRPASATSSRRPRRGGCPRTRPGARSPRTSTTSSSRPTPTPPTTTAGPPTSTAPPTRTPSPSGRPWPSRCCRPTRRRRSASRSWRLRSELDRLLGEHIALAVATLRAGATESPDFPPAAADAQQEHRRPHGRDGHPLRARRRAAVHDAVGRPHRRARRLHHRGGRARRRGPAGRAGQAARLREQAGGVPRHGHRPPDADRGPGQRRSCTTTRC